MMQAPRTYEEWIAFYRASCRLAADPSQLDALQLIANGEDLFHDITEAKKRGLDTKIKLTPQEQAIGNLYLYASRRWKKETRDELKAGKLTAAQRCALWYQLKALAAHRMGDFLVAIKRYSDKNMNWFEAAHRAAVETFLREWEDK
jgi:hypothetical protein